MASQTERVDQEHRCSRRKGDKQWLLTSNIGLSNFRMCHWMLKQKVWYSFRRVHYVRTAVYRLLVVIKTTPSNQIESNLKIEFDAFFSPFDKHHRLLLLLLLKASASSTPLFRHQDAPKMCEDKKWNHRKEKLPICTYTYIWRVYATHSWKYSHSLRCCFLFLFLSNTTFFPSIFIWKYK